MDYQKHLQAAEHLANLLDDEIGLGPWKFGLDPIIGLIPVIGDIIPLLLSLYIHWIAREVGVPERLRHKMMFNSIADAVVGAIPIIGDITDFFWKSNIKNIKLLRKCLSEQPLEGKIVAQPRGWAAMSHS